MFRVIGLVLAVLLVAPTALAQSERERVRVHSAWAQDIGELSVSAMNVIHSVDAAAQIVDSHSAGQITTDQALADLEKWHEGMRERLVLLGVQADQLAEGPALTARGREVAVETIRNQPREVIVIVEGFLDASHIFLADSVRGLDPDRGVYAASQFLVIQTYMDGVRTTNNLSAESIPSTHPQHHLMLSWGEIIEAIVLSFEISRLDYGAQPSRFHVDDMETRLRTLPDRVAEHVRSGRAATRVMIREIRDVRRIAGTPSEEIAEYDMLLSLMDTYPPSFSEEERAALVLSRAMSDALPQSSPAIYDEFMEKVDTYERVRDQLQFSRQRIVAESE